MIGDATNHKGRTSCFLSTKELFGKTGVVTVEAALLYPIIFLIIICLLLAGAVWYQKTYFKAMVGRAAHSVALSVTRTPEDMINPLPKYFHVQDRPVYTFTEKLNELIRSDVRQCIVEDMNRYAVFSFIDQSVTIKTKTTEHMFYKQLLVDVKASCKVPFGYLFGKTDSEGRLIFHERLSTILYDTSELSRHIDMVDDSLKRFGFKDKTDQLFQNLLRHVKVLLEKVH